MFHGAYGFGNGWDAQLAYLHGGNFQGGDPIPGGGEAWASRLMAAELGLDEFGPHAEQRLAWISSQGRAIALIELTRALGGVEGR